MNRVKLEPTSLPWRLMLTHTVLYCTPWHFYDSYAKRRDRVAKKPSLNC